MIKWKKGIILFIFLFLIANVNATYLNVADGRTFDSYAELCLNSNEFNESAYENFFVGYEFNPCLNYNNVGDGSIFSLFFIEETEKSVKVFREYPESNIKYISKFKDFLNLSLDSKRFEDYTEQGQSIESYLLINDEEKVFFEDQQYGNCTINYSYNGDISSKNLGVIFEDLDILTGNEDYNVPQDVCNNLDSIYFLDKLVKFFVVNNPEEVFTSTSVSSETFNLSKLSYTTNFVLEPGSSCFIKLRLNDPIENPIYDLTNYSLIGSEDFSIIDDPTRDFFNISTKEGKPESITIKYFDNQAGSFEKEVSCDNDYVESVNNMDEINITVNFLLNDALYGVDGNLVVEPARPKEESISTTNQYNFTNQLYFSCTSDNNLDEYISFNSNDDFLSVSRSECYCEGINYICNLSLSQDITIKFNLEDKNDDKLENFQFIGSIYSTDGLDSKDLDFLITLSKKGDDINTNFDFINKNWQLSGTVFGPYNYNHTFNVDMLKTDSEFKFEINLTNYPMSCSEFGTKNSYSTKICEDTQYCVGSIYLDNCCYGLIDPLNLCVEKTSSGSDIDGDGVPDNLDACPTENKIWRNDQLETQGEETCSDGIDNDCDMLKDDGDVDCNEQINCINNCSFNLSGIETIDLRCNNQYTEWTVTMDGTNPIAKSLFTNEKVCCINPKNCDGEYYCGGCPNNNFESDDESGYESCRDQLDNDGDGYIDACDDGCKSEYLSLIENQGLDFYDYNLSYTVGIEGFETYDLANDGLDNNCNGKIDEAQFTLDFNVTSLENGIPINNSKVTILKPLPNMVGYTDEGMYQFIFQGNPNGWDFLVEKENPTSDSIQYYVANKTEISGFSDEKRYKKVNVTLSLKKYEEINITVNDSITGTAIIGAKVNCENSDEIFETTSTGLKILSKTKSTRCSIGHSSYFSRVLEIEDGKEVELVPKENVEINLIEIKEKIDYITYPKMQRLEIQLPFADDFTVLVKNPTASTPEKIYNFYNKKIANISLFEYHSQYLEIEVEVGSIIDEDRSFFVAPIGCMKNKSLYIKNDYVYSCNQTSYLEIQGNSLSEIDLYSPGSSRYVKDKISDSSKLLSIKGTKGEFVLGVQEEDCSDDDKYPMIDEENTAYCAHDDPCAQGTFLLSAFSFFFNSIKGNNQKYCYYDIDLKTNFKTMKNCSQVKSCYNYLTKDACETNACSANLEEAGEGCSWNQYNDFGVTKGMCVPYYNETEFAFNEFNCSYESEINHELLYDSNALFDFLNKNLSFDICKIKGNNENSKLNDTCYFTYALNSSLVECENRNERNCQVYRTQEDCEGGINVSYNISDDNYIIQSNDSSGYGWCRWDSDNNICMKDVDMDNEDDCFSDDLLDKYESDKSDNECYKNLEWPKLYIESSDVISNQIDNFVFNFNNSDTYINNYIKGNSDNLNFFFYFDNNSVSNDNFSKEDIFEFSNVVVFENVTIPFEGFYNSINLFDEIDEKKVLFKSSWFTDKLSNGYHNMSYIFVDKTKGLTGQRNKLIYVDNKNFDNNSVDPKRYVKIIENDNFIPKIKQAINFTFNITDETYLKCDILFLNDSDKVTSKYLKENNFVYDENDVATFEIFNGNEIVNIDLWNKINSTGTLQNVTNEKTFYINTPDLPEANYTFLANCTDASGNTEAISKEIEIDNSFYFESIMPFGAIVDKIDENNFKLKIDVPFDSICSVYQIPQNLSDLKQSLDAGFLNFNVLSDRIYNTSEININDLNSTYPSDPIDNLYWLSVECETTNPFILNYKAKIPIINDIEKPEIKMFYNQEFFDTTDIRDISDKTGDVEFTFEFNDNDFNISEETIDDLNSTSEESNLEEMYNALEGYYRGSSFKLTDYPRTKIGESSIGSVIFDNYNSENNPSKSILSDNKLEYKNITFIFEDDEDGIINMNFSDKAGNTNTQRFVVRNDKVAPKLSSLQGDKIMLVNDEIYFASNQSNNVNVGLLNFYRDDYDINDIEKFNTIEMKFKLNFSNIESTKMQEGFDRYYQTFNFSNNNNLTLKYERNGDDSYLRLYHNLDQLISQAISINGTNHITTPIEDYDYLLLMDIFVTKEALDEDYIINISYNNSKNNIQFNESEMSNIKQESKNLQQPVHINNLITEFYLYVDELQNNEIEFYIRDEDNNEIWSRTESDVDFLNKTLTFDIDFQYLDNLTFQICDNVSNCKDYIMKYDNRGPTFNLVANTFNTINHTYINYSIEDTGANKISIDNSFARVELYKKGYYNGTNNLINYPSYKYNQINDDSQGVWKLILSEIYSNSDLVFTENTRIIEEESINSINHVKFINNYQINASGFNNNKRYLFNLSNIGEDQGFNISTNEFYFQSFNNDSYFYNATIEDNKLILNFSQDERFYSIQTHEYNSTNDNQWEGNFTVDQPGEYLLIAVIKNDFGTLGYKSQEIEYKDTENPKFRYITEIDGIEEINNKNVTNQSINFTYYIYDKNLFSINITNQDKSNVVYDFDILNDCEKKGVIPQISYPFGFYYKCNYILSTQNMSIGKNEIILSVNDIQGNKKQQSNIIYYDKIEPTIT